MAKILMDSFFPFAKKESESTEKVPQASPFRLKKKKRDINETKIPKFYISHDV